MGNAAIIISAHSLFKMLYCSSCGITLSITQQEASLMSQCNHLTSAGSSYTTTACFAYCVRYIFFIASDPRWKIPKTLKYFNSHSLLNRPTFIYISIFAFFKYCSIVRLVEQDHGRPVVIGGRLETYCFSHLSLTEEEADADGGRAGAAVNGPRGSSTDWQ